MTFQIGDKVVYPNQGVGIIENISSRTFGSAFERFYLLRLGCNSMTVLVPFSNAANIGLRRVTKDREIARVLSYLSNGWCEIKSDWKVRFKENTERMQSGDLLRAAIGLEIGPRIARLHGCSLIFPTAGARSSRTGKCASKRIPSACRAGTCCGRPSGLRSDQGSRDCTGALLSFQRLVRDQVGLESALQREYRAHAERGLVAGGHRA